MEKCRSVICVLKEGWKLGAGRYHCFYDSLFGNFHACDLNYESYKNCKSSCVTETGCLCLQTNHRKNACLLVGAFRLLGSSSVSLKLSKRMDLHAGQTVYGVFCRAYHILGIGCCS